jgi:hypothetical protein
MEGAMKQARLAGFLGFSALALSGDAGAAAALQGVPGRLETTQPGAIETVTYGQRHGGHGHFSHNRHGRHHYGHFGPWWGYPRYAYYPRTPYYYPAPDYYYPPYYYPAPVYYPAPIYAYPVP